MEAMDQGAVTLFVGLSKAIENVPLKVLLWAWAMHFGFCSEFFEYSVGTSSISGGCSFSEGCVADPMQTPAIETEGICGWH